MKDNPQRSTAMTALGHRRSLVIHLLTYLIPTLVVISVLGPEWQHYYVSGTEPDREVVEGLRYAPSEALLDELDSLSLMENFKWMSKVELMAAADEVLRDGRLHLKGLPEFSVDLPFRAQDLETGLPTWQLRFASLVIPEVLLEAYLLSGREKYFDQARKSIIAWARYERSAWWPKGYLWNDHALAARTLVLARFWHHYRKRPDYDAAEARLIVGFAARSGRILAKASNFTFATNHGVMQNLALLHIALVFPALPQAEEFRRIAEMRLAQQMAFYLNEEGVVLEHSAGYHRDGLVLVGMALRYLSLLGRPIPEAWRLKYERAQHFYAQLRRPDGSLPMFGNTSGAKDPLGPPIARLDNQGRVIDWGYKDWRPQAARNLYPVAGYAVWWAGLERWPDRQALSQTVVAWSNFPGHGHKLADELSVLYWADGQSWWTNVGYWPYGVNGREQAISWNGSNAPHLAGEDRRGQRTVRLQYAGRKDDVVAIDLQRTTADGYRVRRQVVGIQGRITVVIDNANDSAGRRTRAVWRVYPGVRVQTGSGPGAYRLSTAASDTTLAVYFVGGGSDLVTELVHGKNVEGHVAIEQIPTATSAIIVEHDSNDLWAAVVWSAGKKEAGGHPEKAPVMQRWQDAEHWELQIPVADRMLHVAREGEKIKTSYGGRLHSVLQLERVEDVGSERERLQQALAATGRAYGKYADLSDYRIRVMYVLFGLLLLQELLLMILRRYKPAIVSGLRLASLVAWVGLGLWLYFVYFKI